MVSAACLEVRHAVAAPSRRLSRQAAMFCCKTLLKRLGSHAGVVYNGQIKYRVWTVYGTGTGLVPDFVVGWW